MNNTEDILRNSRSVISELLDKAWEIGGCHIGDEEFENYDWVKDARIQLGIIDKSLTEKENSEKELLLHEAIADISQIATKLDYYSGDSRQDIANFIRWAKEFESIHKDTQWDLDFDYIETIEKFAENKVKECSEYKDSYGYGG